MPETGHRPRGTTFVPLAIDVTRPSRVLLGAPERLHGWERWRRPLLILGATALALALLLATRPW